MSSLQTTAPLERQLTQYAEDFQELLARHTDLQLRFEHLQTSHARLTAAGQIWSNLGRPANDTCPTLSATEIQRAVRTLHATACHDPLTGLHNLSYFSELVDERIARALGGLSGGTRFTVMHVALYRLQWIRDVDGAECADAAIVAASARLQTQIRGCDLLARVAFDKFVILVSGPVNEVELDEIEKRISRVLALPTPFHKKKLVLRARIGRARFPQEGIDATTLLAHAEAALEPFPKIGHSA